MDELLLPELKISDESQLSDIENFLKIIKPSWLSDRLQIKLLSGGFSNKMYRCYDETNPEDSVIVRVRYLSEILSPDKPENPMELKAIRLLSSLGHFPKVHATFANGYCYQYIKGEPLVNETHSSGNVDDRMIRAIADEMAFIHSLRFEDVENGDLGSFDFLDTFLNLLDFETLLDYGLNKNRLLKEKDLISNFFKNKNPRRVLCHGDIHFGNCVWDEEEEKITIVDWETAHIGYQLDEIASFFFRSVQLHEIVFGKESRNKIIKDDFQEKFVKYYVTAWRKYNKDDTQVTENDVVQWMKEIEIFYLLPRLSLFSAGLIKSDYFTDYSGDINLVEIFYTDYLALKEKVFNKRSFETE